MDDFIIDETENEELYGLRRVFFDLKPEWEEEARLLREKLRGEGIACAAMARELLPALAAWKREAVVLTDSFETGKLLAGEGIIYFGCCRRTGPVESLEAATPQDYDSDFFEEDAWFDGAALVLGGFEEIDGRYLEEWMCRAQGRPARIAETEHLVIREIAERDLPELLRIGREDEGRALLREDMFTWERLYSYRKTVYRLQGYGLWSVLLKGRLIGCCGFAPFQESIVTGQSVDTKELTCVLYMRDKTEDPGQTDAAGGRKQVRMALELQYMLDTPCRRQGFGTEMCRAALSYARERLGADEIWLRIQPDNTASRALAGKLGFHESRSSQYSTLHFLI